MSETTTLKRYVVVREVVEWDSDKAYRDHAQYDDEYRRQQAEAVAASRKGWKVQERDSAFATRVQK